MSEEPTIQTFESLSGPAARLAVAGWLELEEKGLGTGQVTVRPDLHATVAFDSARSDALPIGVVAWERRGDVVEVVVAYVVEEHRGSGVMARIWESLFAWAGRSGAGRVRVTVDARHKAARDVARKLGLVEVGVVLEAEASFG